MSDYGTLSSYQSSEPILDIVIRSVASQYCVCTWGRLRASMMCKFICTLVRILCVCVSYIVSNFRMYICL